VKKVDEIKITLGPTDRDRREECIMMEFKDVDKLTLSFQLHK
jgi:hypothetical protein